MNKTLLAATTLLAWNLATTTATAMPLKPGLYRWASKYIQIAQKGDRLCYQGSTARASLTASLQRDSQNPEIYRLHGAKDLVVKQNQADQILYGSRDNLLPYTAEAEPNLELNPAMQQCLKSTKPYYKQQEFRR